MKLNRTYLFIVISSVALFTVLIIQVNWILETARIKEELFNERAKMVLARTTDALLADKQACKEIEDEVEKNISGSSARLKKKEIHKIDSLFNYYMKFYDFYIGYTFDVVKPKSNNFYSSPQACYDKNLDAMAVNNGFELKLIFPDKKKYILEELSTLFIASVILVVIVLFLFWRTVMSLLKEKRLSEHTTDFLNNMTHEFKTPLTNISLAAKMMVKGQNIGQDDKIKHYSGIILDENERLKLQVEQVLSMTALERDDMFLQKSELDFHPLIADALKHISIQIESRQGTINQSLDAEHSVIMGDRMHLMNALSNLFDNAIKYSNEEPVLTVQTYNKDEHLIIVVSDNGIGIENDYQKKVFDKFFRVPTGDVHDVKGFGLGLAYVKKIIELHEGIIELKSERGKGTTFTITLPNV